jgi:hypothetical protein
MRRVCRGSFRRSSFARAPIVAHTMVATRGSASPMGRDGGNGAYRCSVRVRNDGQRMPIASQIDVPVSQNPVNRSDAALTVPGALDHYPIIVQLPVGRRGHCVRGQAIATSWHQLTSPAAPRPVPHISQRWCFPSLSPPPFVPGDSGIRQRTRGTGCTPCRTARSGFYLKAGGRMSMDARGRLASFCYTWPPECFASLTRIPLSWQVQRHPCPLASRYA